MEFVTNPNRLYNEWTIRMECLWNPYGIHMELVEIPMDSPWNPCAISRQSIWNHLESIQL